MYDLPARQLLCHSRFASGGSSLLWAPLEVDPSGSTLLAGFQDGVLRCAYWRVVAGKVWGEHVLVCVIRCEMYGEGWGGSTCLCDQRYFPTVYRVLQLEECERRHQKGDPGYQLVLLHVCKPHSTAVSSLAVNSAGEVLACGVSPNMSITLSLATYSTTFHTLSSLYRAETVLCFF